MIIAVCSRATLEPVGTIDATDGRVRFLTGSAKLHDYVSRALSHGVFCSGSIRTDTPSEVIVDSVSRRVEQSDPDFLNYLDSSLGNAGFCTGDMAEALRRHYANTGVTPPRVMS